MRWFPLAAHWLDRRPEVGDVVAFQHAAWAVTHISDAIPTEDEERYLAAYTPKGRAHRAPYKISLRRIHGPKHKRENDRQEIGLRASVHAPPWYAYPSGRVPLCSCCGDPAPCRMEVAERQAAHEAEVMSQRLDRTMPGVCYGCGEPITARQRSIRYPEPNVEVPGAPPPVFHARKPCRGEAMRYEKLRNAEPLATWYGWAEQEALP